MKLCKAGVPFVVRVVATIQQPTIDDRWMLAAALEPWCYGAQRGSWKKPTSFHCSQVIDPDIDERKHQVLFSAAWEGTVVCPTICKCLLYVPCNNLCFVVTGTRGKESGVRDWRQCEQWGECPKDSVVRGLGLPEIRYKICTWCTGGASHLSGGPELTAVPSPDVIVGGIPSSPRRMSVFWAGPRLGTYAQGLQVEPPIFLVDWTNLPSRLQMS